MIDFVASSRLDELLGYIASEHPRMVAEIRVYNWRVNIVTLHFDGPVSVKYELGRWGVKRIRVDQMSHTISFQSQFAASRERDEVEKAPMERLRELILNDLRGDGLRDQPVILGVQDLQRSLEAMKRVR